MARNGLLFKAVIASVWVSSNAFTLSRIHQFGSFQNHFAANTATHVIDPSRSDETSVGQGEHYAIVSAAEKPGPVERKICDFVADGDVESSVELLKHSIFPVSGQYVHDMAYEAILRALSDHSTDDAPTIAEEVLSTYIEDRGSPATNEIHNLVISIWSRSSRQDAAEKCCSMLDMLWMQHRKTGDDKFVPFRSSYISTITALSRSRRRRGQENAKTAEALLEELEEKKNKYPHLTPNTITVNAVLNAWSKSRLWHGAARRCEQILDRMVKVYKDRPELKPGTTSFNTVIDTLAKSKEHGREQRAENLLEQMEELDRIDESICCTPDHVSFNAVINCWAQSRVPGAAARATAILSHMTERYETNSTNVSPDAASYTTVINAWARSREDNAVESAEEIFQLCEETFRKGNDRVKPNALTYNSLINCYAKSNHDDASEKAIRLLECMKERCKAPGFEDCHPDVVTYTSVIDTLAKKKSVEAAAKAEALLDELENAHKIAPDDPRLKPNVRTYTSVINAIGRSGRNPERAEAILQRLENLARDGNKAVAPDVVAYNAAINAYGWSNCKDKSAKCSAVLRRMIEFSDSGENRLATPDVITCNSVLNACAFEDAKTEAERAEIIRIVVETLETFQQRIPKYGYPDHATFSQVLLAISRHMPPGDQRDEMAKATFWQCCQAGHVNAKVVSSLHQALSWPRFAEIMGSALTSAEGEKPVYQMKLFPQKWTRHAPQKQRSQASRASRKRDGGFQTTKQAMTRRANKRDT